MELDFIEDLISTKSKNKLILFVGSGVPASIGMPTWKELIKFLILDLGIEEDSFKTYGDFLQLASYYVHQKGDISKLQEFIKENTKQSRTALSNSLIYRLITDLKFKKVYTTNYDRLLEVAYHRANLKHKTFRTINDFREPDHEYQIIKFHGDVDYKRNFVLTEESYFDRLDFEHPFDIKLKSDLIGNSVLFIGYSLSDLNIRYLLYKINKLWSKEDTNQMESYIFLSDENPVRESILKKYGINVIHGNTGDLTKDLEDFLQSLNNSIKS